MQAVAELQPLAKRGSGLARNCILLARCGHTAVIREWLIAHHGKIRLIRDLYVTSKR